MTVPKFIQKLQARDREKREKIRSKLDGEAVLYMGDPTLDWGVGGWVRGRCNLMYGPTGSGKSTLALMAAGAEQKKTNGWVIIFDSEYAHNDINEVDEDGNLTAAAKEQRARYIKAGLDPDKVYQAQSNVVDELFGDLGDFEKELKSDPSFVSAIIVDSWGGIQGEIARKRIEEGEVVSAGNQYGGNAKTIGPILQTLLRISAEYGVTSFFVQHCMKNTEQYGPKWLLIGGEKLKFLVHNVLFLESVSAKDASLITSDTTATKEDDIVTRVGKKIRFRCEKSRRVVEGRKGEFWLDFVNMKFALPQQSLFNLATSLGIIAHPKTPVYEESGKNKGKQKIDPKTGQPVFKENVAWWEYPVGAPTPHKWHGQSQVEDALAKNKDLFNEIYQACLASNKKEAITEKIGEEVGVGEDKNDKKAN